MSQVTKREQRAQSRLERHAREEKIARRQQATRWIVLAVAAAVLLAIAAFAVIQLAVPAFESPIGVPLSDEGRGHVPEGSLLEFQNSPPASGKHYARTANYGFHDEPVAAGYWVHNLEHGAIVVLYNCPNDCPALKDQLRQIYDTFPQGKFKRVKLVIVPDTAITTQLVALAWNRKLELIEFNREQLLSFYNAYVDRGPEDAA